MQTRSIDQGHIWLLSGTGEGPLIATALISRGWKVSVSVVSLQASKKYLNLPLEALWIGALGGALSIQSLLQEKSFDYVVDATHPFALMISSDLHRTCKKKGQALLRYERPIVPLSDAFLIDNLETLATKSLVGHSLLLALGSRHLKQAVSCVYKGGGDAFARILPTVESLQTALKAELPDSHLAVVRPLEGEPQGELETALCRKWAITDVVCRQSGGSTELTWQKICKSQNINLWLLKRPPSIKEVESVYSVNELLDKVGAS